MAVLDSNEIFFTAFEPKQQNRFMLNMAGVPAYMVKSLSAIGLTQNKITIHYINVLRNIKGKTIWNDLTMTLYDPITPSGAQAVMEWVRLGHESVTGRDGYSDFYKKDLTLNVLGPVGDIVSEWVLKGAIITTAEFGEYNYDNTEAVQNLTIGLAIDYAVLNY